MVYIPNRTGGVLDMHADAVLRDIANGAETGSAAETPVKLDVIDATDYADRQLGSLDYTVMIRVTSAATPNGNETYTIALEVDADTTFAGAVKVAELVVPGTGIFYLEFNVPTVEALHSTHKYLRANLTAAGTAPSIVYGATITRDI